jgi:hypothetical protein
VKDLSYFNIAALLIGYLVMFAVGAVALWISLIGLWMWGRDQMNYMRYLWKEYKRERLERKLKQKAGGL